MTSNGVALDFITSTGPISSQHDAFLVSEGEFDECLARLLAAGVEHFPGPGLGRSGATNDNDGERGLHVEDPAGHVMELLTRLYGSGGGEG